MSDQNLFLEERVAVARAMINNTNSGTFDLSREGFRRFALQMIAVLDGDRRAVPKDLRPYLRKPRRGGR